MLKVTLDNRGNPDFRQDPSARLPGTKAGKVAVANLEEASKRCRRYIEENELGGGNWTGGRIEDAEGREVGRVSYNGSVWPPGPETIGQEPIWPPRKKQAAESDRLVFLAERLEVPGHGKVDVSGCYRVAHVTSVPGEFAVEGRRHDFSSYIYLDANGLKSIGKFELHKDGAMFDSTPCPQHVRQAVTKAVKQWAATDEGKRMVLENEVRDRTSTLAYQDRLVDSRSKDLDKAVEERSKAQDALDEAETLLSEMTGSGPTP